MNSNRISSKNRRWIILLLIVMLLASFQRPVYAQQLMGSLQLDCHVNVDGRSIPLANDTYAIVKIADITVQESLAILTYKTTEQFSSFQYDWANLDDNARRQAAQELAAFAQEQPELLSTTKITDRNGELTFSQLEPALYLMVRTKVDVANRACSLDPFLVDIPTIVNGKLEYTLTAVPKFDYQSIRLRPCNVTIYMGGNEGYDAVGGVQTTSLPKPMFVIEAPEGVAVENLTLLYYDAPNYTGNPGKRFEWTPVEIGKDEEGNVCYRLDRKDGTDEDFHVQYYADGESVQIDEFQPELEEELYKMYTTGIPLSEGEVLVAYVTSEEGSVFYPIQRGTAELTVRGVERESIISNPENPVTRVFAQEETIPEIPAGVGVVVAPEGTTYTLNETDIELENLYGDSTEMDVGLLFDDIMNEVYDRQSLLEAQADECMPELEPGATRHFQSQYLDLVDMNNGNAWVMASNPVEIYWGYPEGTDANTSFTLWHFRGLHRDGTDDAMESGYNLEDIMAVEPEKVFIENTLQGIRFTAEPGGFSPFVLVWEENTGSDEDSDSPVLPQTPSDQVDKPIRIPFLPQTGDTALYGWLTILLVGCIGIVSITIYKAYEKKKQK